MQAEKLLGGSMHRSVSHSTPPPQYEFISVKSDGQPESLKSSFSPLTLLLGGTKTSSPLADGDISPLGQAEAENSGELFYTYLSETVSFCVLAAC